MMGDIGPAGSLGPVGPQGETGPAGPVGTARSIGTADADDMHAPAGPTFISETGASDHRSEGGFPDRMIALDRDDAHEYADVTGQRLSDESWPLRSRSGKQIATHQVVGDDSTSSSVSPAMAKTRGLSHISLHVGDIERSVRFYRDAFGLEVLMDYDGPVGSDGIGRQAVLSTPGRDDLIALSQVESAPVGPGGLNHFGFLLENDAAIEDRVRDIERAGGRLISRGVREERGASEAFAYVSDPDDYIIELSTQSLLLSHKRG
jgi:catechol 2,3-dioxygenase-like lactoylglutathione lyase family enzyme